MFFPKKNCIFFNQKLPTFLDLFCVLNPLGWVLLCHYSHRPYFTLQAICSAVSSKWRLSLILFQTALRVSQHLSAYQNKWQIPKPHILHWCRLCFFYYSIWTWHVRHSNVILLSRADSSVTQYYLQIYSPGVFPTSSVLPAKCSPHFKFLNLFTGFIAFKVALQFTHICC